MLGYHLFLGLPFLRVLLRQRLPFVEGGEWVGEASSFTFRLNNFIRICLKKAPCNVYFLMREKLLYQEKSLSAQSGEPINSTDMLREVKIILNPTHVRAVFLFCLSKSN